MDDHQILIEHVIQHYIDRDLFRNAASEYLDRINGDRWIYGLTTTFLHRSSTTINAKVVHDTRESLKRCKPETVHYLHERLHKETYLDIHTHIHSGEAIFTYVIQEDFV